MKTSLEALKPGSGVAVRTILAGMSLLCAPGCGSPRALDDGPTTAVVGRPTSVDEPERLMLESRVGEEVIVDLASNGGTGYTWSMTAHSEGVELVASPTTTQSDPGLPGGETTTSFRLRMLGPGRQTARLELARIWEADTPPVRTVTVVIRVDEGR